MERKRLRLKKRRALRRLRASYRKEQREEFARAVRRFFGLLPPAESEMAKRRANRLVRAERAMHRAEQWKKFRERPFRYFTLRKELPAELKALRKLYIAEMRDKRKQAIADTAAAFVEICRMRDLRGRAIYTYFVSLANYILAFLFVYVVYQLATILMASSFDIPVIWNYHRLDFPLYTYSPLYTRSALVIIFGAGPVISILMGLIAQRLFFMDSPFFRRYNLFFLWTFIHGMNMFFGAYIVGFLTRTEFIYTTEWLFMSRSFDVEEIVFAILSVTVGVLVGYLATPLFLLASGSHSLIKPRYRFYFILLQSILPWFTGAILVFLLTLPTPYLPLILKTITPLIMLIPTLVAFNAERYREAFSTVLIKRQSFRWGLVIIVAAVLFFYRVILNQGWRFS
jgi:hypothetical protein